MGFWAPGLWEMFLPMEGWVVFKVLPTQTRSPVGVKPKGQCGLLLPIPAPGNAWLRAPLLPHCTKQSMEFWQWGHWG